MRPEVHIAVLKALEKTKPELSEDTTFPVSEVVTFDVNGTVQTGKSTTVTPTFKPPGRRRSSGCSRRTRAGHEEDDSSGEQS